MTKRALIAEPDQEEALRQAAILKDDGYDALVFTGADIVAAVEASPPDVVVLRHERPGAQTGLALVPRLKTVAPGTAIVLTTSDLTPDAIDKAVTAALEHGGRLVKAAYDTYYNARQAIMEDPEGNVFRINHRKGPRIPADELENPPWEQD